MKTLSTLDDVNRVVGDTPCKLVVIRFGDQEDALCIHTDALLESISAAVSNFVDIYACERLRELVDVMDLNSPVNIMCFFNRRHIKVDCGSGDVSKIAFLIDNEEMLVELLTLVYKAGVRNKGIVKSPFTFGDMGNR